MINGYVLIKAMLVSKVGIS